MKDNKLIDETLEALHRMIKLITDNSDTIENDIYYIIELHTIRKILEKIKNCDSTSATKCFTCINSINRGDLL